MVRPMTENVTTGAGKGSDATPPRVRPVKLVDLVYGKLLERIQLGEYAPDSRLPAEHDLAAMFGVSRPIVLRPTVLAPGRASPQSLHRLFAQGDFDLAVLVAHEPTLSPPRRSCARHHPDRRRESH